ncbi:hypothetical protein ACFOUP_17520 [Belliella kenyensis]|uniref:Uncharacterized protein n=1 Tax=Belliella kenyensis TaxID=1472724 RepID=A0ABV8ET74_9BACT|nr:hypothetical protein [Belliella kenyensis]MCH7402509.1 hypothetical protein [Belliella kenyensis]MDN3603308.1 hypothetical protein [Belliella kenyensis]
MRICLVILFVFSSFLAFSQEKIQLDINQSLLLYPEIYFVATFDLDENVTLSSLNQFCEEQDTILFLNQDECSIIKVLPSSIGSDRDIQLLKESVLDFFKNVSNPIDIKSYGREYLPEKYLVFCKPTIKPNIK